MALFIFTAAATLDLARPHLTAAFCTGDCDRSGAVNGSESVMCRGIAVGSRPLSTCPACDCDQNGMVTEAEADRAQQNSTNGCNANECPAATATPVTGPSRTPTRTTGPSTPTWTGTGTPTRTGTAAPATATTHPSNTPPNAPTSTVASGACIGDCDTDHKVMVSELVTGVTIALDRAAVSACAAFDSNRSNTVSVDELVQGVNDLLHGCP